VLKTAPNSHTKHHHALHSWTSLGDPSHKKAHAPRISIAGSESRRRDIEKKTLRELPLPAPPSFHFHFHFLQSVIFFRFFFLTFRRCLQSWTHSWPSRRPFPALSWP
jgi:hypothetical protein